MLRKFLVPGALSLACLLMVTDVASAQRRGGGGSRGGGRGNWNNGTSVGVNIGGVGVWSGPNGTRVYYDGGYYGGYGRPYYGGYSSGYYYPSTSYYEPSYSYYSEPANTYTAPVDDSAHIRVMLPDSSARVWFDGAPTSQTGTDRMFNTPSLTTGVNHTYQIRATWMVNGRETSQTRTVNVMAGQTSLVDFTRQVSEPIPR